MEELKSAEGLPFRNLLSAEVIAESIEDISYRNRIFTPDVTLWALLSQVLNKDQTLQGAVARVVASFVGQGQQPPSINTAAYSKARSRLPEKTLSDLVRRSGEQMEEEVPVRWLWKRSKHIKLVDGTTISMPDTAENQAIYPQPDSQKAGVGFPIARVVGVISCATGAVLDLAIGPYSGKETGEHALLRQLMGSFKAGDIALGDAYYGSFFLIAMLMKLGVDAVFPIHAGRTCDFRRGKRLGKKDHEVQWNKPRKPEWMDQETYDEFPDKIAVREVSIQSDKKGFRTKPRIMVTTFLDPKQVSKKDLGVLYSYRWWVELDFRSIKETLQMDILRGKTPEMVHKEMWAHLLAYNLIRKIMAQAAYAHDKNPRELSFKLALQVIEAFREAGIFLENNSVVYMQLLKAIAYRTVGNRAGRQEPRRVKRRPKAFPRLQKARHLYRKVV